MQSRSRATIGVLLLVVLSLALRLWMLRGRPLWFDELFTFWASRLPLRSLLDALRFDSGPPGFYLLEKPFALLADRFAHAEAWLRAPSFLAALALFAAGGTLSPGAPRAAFAALAAGSTLSNLYAAEARAYAVLGLLALVLFLLALRGVDTPARLAETALLAALALYTHYLALFVVGALLVLALAARRRRSAAALAAGVVAFGPWIPILRAQPEAAMGWIAEPFGATAAGMLSALGGVGRVPTPFGAPAPPLLFAAGAVAGTAGLALALAASRGDSGVRQSVSFVVLVLGGALLAGLWKPIAFAGRTETVVLPVWFWGLAAGTRARPALRGVCAAAVALGLLATAVTVFSPRALPAPSAVAESLSRAAGPKDVVVASASFYLPARLAFERGSLAAPVRSLPPELALHPGWFVPALPGPREERVLATYLSAIPRGGRLFLVLPPPYLTEGVTRVLASGGDVRPLIRSRDAAVTLWTPGASPPPATPAPTSPVAR